MSEDQKNNPRNITSELCEAYRGALEDKYASLEKNLVRMEGRQWAILVSVILAIILVILSIYVQT